MLQTNQTLYQNSNGAEKYGILLKAMGQNEFRLNGGWTSQSGVVAYETTGLFSVLQAIVYGFIMHMAH
jgi:hypothetical protein